MVTKWVHDPPYCPIPFTGVTTRGFSGSLSATGGSSPAATLSLSIGDSLYSCAKSGMHNNRLKSKTLASTARLLVFEDFIESSFINEFSIVRIFLIGEAVRTISNQNQQTSFAI
jgi:hypothetical protein